MSYRFRPLLAAASLALAFSAQAAKPAKPAKPATAPAAAVVFELAHNLSPKGEESLVAVVDRFNKESGGNLKLVRLEKGSKPAESGSSRRHE